MSINFLLFKDTINNCYTRIIDKTCIMDFKAQNNKTYLIIIHPIPEFAEGVEHHVSRYQPISPFFAYLNETFYGFAYKIIEINFENEQYQYLRYSVINNIS